MKMVSNNNLNIKISNKGVVPILGVILLLLVTVSAGTTLYKWGNTFESNYQVKIQTGSSNDVIDFGNFHKYGSNYSYIELKTNGDSYFILNNVTLNSVNCPLLSSNVVDSVTYVYLNCSVVSNKLYTLMIYTNNGIFSKKVKSYSSVDNILFN